MHSARAGDDPEPLAAARQASKAAAEAEHLRLLYVALTRARDRLYIGGYETNRARDPGSWHALAETAIIHSFPTRRSSDLDRKSVV